jgi:hypothetical protein
MALTLPSACVAGIGVQPQPSSVNYVYSRRRRAAPGRTATADGRVFAESDEKLIAHGSTGCVILG